MRRREFIDAVASYATSVARLPSGAEGVGSPAREARQRYSFNPAASVLHIAVLGGREPFLWCSSSTSTEAWTIGIPLLPLAWS